LPADAVVVINQNGKYAFYGLSALEKKRVLRVSPRGVMSGKSIEAQYAAGQAASQAIPVKIPEVRVGLVYKKGGKQVQKRRQ
jgi:hypothetical protein